MANKKNTVDYFQEGEKLRFEISLTPNLLAAITDMAQADKIRPLSPKRFIEYTMLKTVMAYVKQEQKKKEAKNG